MFKVDSSKKFTVINLILTNSLDNLILNRERVVRDSIFRILSIALSLSELKIWRKRVEDRV